MAIAARRFPRPVGTRARGRGRIRQSANPYSIDSVLRIVHTLILAREGGFLLHSAGAIRNGKAFLFSGVSGAGKTTISRLAPPDVTLLTDEVSYIRRDQDGYRACGTPFAGELARVGENCSAPIGCLFFLKQGPENKIEPVAKAEAIRRLMRNILFFAEDSDLVQRVFQSACEFVERVPVQQLTFVPDSRVWDMIRMSERDASNTSRRSSAIASRMLGGEMMIMSAVDSTFFTLNPVATRDLAGRRRLHAAF